MKKSIIFLGYSDLGVKTLNIISKRTNIAFKFMCLEGVSDNELKKIKKVFNDSIIFDSFKEMQDYININKNCRPDIGFISGFKYLLKEDLISFPIDGFYNLHTSLLPKYKGVHPINWAIIKDESCTGLTIHKIDSSVDGGVIYCQEKVDIEDSDDVNTVKIKLFDKIEDITVRFFSHYFGERKLEVIPQSFKDISFAPKRTPLDSKIHFNQRTRNVFNFIRALVDPFPNAFCYNQKGERVIIKNVYKSKVPGMVIAKIKENIYIITTVDGVIAVEADISLKYGDILN